jgi:hypothetical protein
LPEYPGGVYDLPSNLISREKARALAAKLAARLKHARTITAHASPWGANEDPS